MSKVTAMQAIRQARYAERADRAALAATVPPSVVAPTPTSPAGGEQPVAGDGEAGPTGLLPSAVVARTMLEPQAELLVDPAPHADADPTALCGHRSMNNRSCRRPAGHPEKNHRYT